ncbi:hypothetical protein P3T40_005173 [Paraburkholderia sp. EB58]|jgi:hypothetical protein
MSENAAPGKLPANYRRSGFVRAESAGAPHADSSIGSGLVRTVLYCRPKPQTVRENRSMVCWPR